MSESVTCINCKRFTAKWRATAEYIHSLSDYIYYCPKCIPDNNAINCEGCGKIFSYAEYMKKETPPLQRIVVSGNAERLEGSILLCGECREKENE